MASETDCSRRSEDMFSVDCTTIYSDPLRNSNRDNEESSSQEEPAPEQVETESLIDCELTIKYFILDIPSLRRQSPSQIIWNIQTCLHRRGARRFPDLSTLNQEMSNHSTTR